MMQQTTGGPEMAGAIGGAIGGMCGSIFAIIYPICVIVFMTRPKVVEYCQSQAQSTY